MTLDGAIKRAEEVAEKNKEDFRLCPSQECDGTQDCRCLKNGEGKGCLRCAAEYRQLAEWLKILKSAKFEYDEAWRTITHPTPDVTYADKQRAQVILDKFRNSLGAISALQTQDVNDKNTEDTISRWNVIDELKRYFHDEYYQRTSIQDCINCFIEDILTKLPSAQPEIIRCKDCKWWSNDDYRECSSPNYDDGYVTPAGFYCGYAERRTE